MSLQIQSTGDCPQCGKDHVLYKVVKQDGETVRICQECLDEYYGNITNQPTPYPWSVVEIVGGSGFKGREVHIQSSVINCDNYVCKVEGNSHEQAKINAQLIVDCVNSSAFLHHKDKPVPNWKKSSKEILL